MTNSDVYDVYAAFLVQCRNLLGPFDVDRLASDEAYRADFYNRISLSADDKLFELAKLVNQSLSEETASIH